MEALSALRDETILYSQGPLSPNRVHSVHFVGDSGIVVFQFGSLPDPV